MRWAIVIVIAAFGVLWILLQSGHLPPAVASVVEPVLGLACSLAIPLLVISAYAIPGLYRSLNDDLHHWWERIRTRRHEMEDLERKIAHLDKPYHMVQLGTVCAAQGRTARAAELFQQALAKDSSLLDARYRLGLCYFAQGRFQQSAELLEEVHAAKPDYDYGMAYLRLAEAWQHVGNAARATEVFEILLRFYPGHPEGAYHYAQLLAGSGGFERAKCLMREVIFTVRHSPGFQRRRNRHWAIKAQWWLWRNGKTTITS